MQEYEIINITEDETGGEFYPTPPDLIDRMLNGVKWEYINTILEPSAGKGDILRRIAEKSNIYRARNSLDVDCIEIDSNLRQILKYNFSSERKREVRGLQREIEDRRTYDREAGYVFKSPSDRAKHIAYESELRTFFNNGIHIVHDDFLTYKPYKQYNLIVMNPPFSNGDKHLLKALEIQKNGGNIICLLNAETIRNPFTDTRRELSRLLSEYNASVEYISAGFSKAERKTDVEVALIKVSIEQVQEESDIYNRFKKAEQLNDNVEMSTDLEVTDYIKAAVSHYKVEVGAGVDLIRQYKAMIPYMSRTFDDNKHPILRLTDSNDRGYDIVSINDYLKAVRLKYWRALLCNKKFTGKLTSKLQVEYSRRIDKYADYDFSEFNIYTLSAEMNAQIKSGIEDEIITMFDRLTEEHSWYSETAKNRHYYDGWATNKAHKIGDKVIIPCYGVFDSWYGKPRVYEATKTLNDIEKILNFLDGGMTREVKLSDALDACFKCNITKNIELKYFKATFYKKGTVHLVFNCPKLIERFNIYAAQNKKWLPPCYGKKKYSDMSADEKTVIDGFQGETDYENVRKNANYYLASPTNKNNLMLIEERQENERNIIQR